MKKSQLPCNNCSNYKNEIDDLKGINDKKDVKISSQKLDIEKLTKQLSIKIKENSKLDNDRNIENNLAKQLEQKINIITNNLNEKNDEIKNLTNQL